MSFALENQLKELQEQNKVLLGENGRLQADLVKVESGNIRLWKEKEMSSYNHALYAGEFMHWSCDNCDLENKLDEYEPDDKYRGAYA